jgi:hypothetical protein
VASYVGSLTGPVNIIIVTYYGNTKTLQQQVQEACKEYGHVRVM